MAEQQLKHPTQPQPDKMFFLQKSLKRKRITTILGSNLKCRLMPKCLWPDQSRNTAISLTVKTITNRICTCGYFWNITIILLKPVMKHSLWVAPRCDDVSSLDDGGRLRDPACCQSPGPLSADQPAAAQASELHPQPGGHCLIHRPPRGYAH